MFNDVPTVTEVIHIKDAPAGWVDDDRFAYIGRPGNGLKGPWGNPYVLKYEKDRLKVLANYKRWLYRQPFFYRENMAKALWGKTLVCFCKPRICHGDIIADYLDRGYEEELRQLRQSSGTVR